MISVWYHLTNEGYSYRVVALEPDRLDNGICYLLDAHFFIFSDCTGHSENPILAKKKRSHLTRSVVLHRRNSGAAR